MNGEASKRRLKPCGLPSNSMKMDIRILCGCCVQRYAISVDLGTFDHDHRRNHSIIFLSYWSVGLRSGRKSATDEMRRNIVPGETFHPVLKPVEGCLKIERGSIWLNWQRGCSF